MLRLILSVLALGHLLSEAPGLHAFTLVGPRL